ncbi:C6 transcription factor [Apiospora marii]|uniref:C6 transcription factor n=1 Tax=Apiospora marii TaxID=335849 RepID=A0ABR1RZP4_9PEZI
MSAPHSPDALPAAAAVKSQRVLACVLCQQRKVKCDRKFPCSGCVKHGIQCVPATQTRRRRRRFPERDLLARLRYYEDLLRQNKIKFDPLHGPSQPSSSVHDDDDKDSPQGSYESGDEQQTETVVALGPSPAPPAASYQAKDFWQAMGSAFRETNVNNDIESLTLGISKLMVHTAMNQMYDNDDHLLFGSRDSHSAVDLSTLHPEPIQIFRLWQVYLDNVDPLLKVTHIPTLQGRIVDAASRLKGIDRNLEALMFSIYSMAVLSLDKDECESMFGLTKKDLTTKYQFACQQALSNASFLRCNDRDCLTAMFLYLLSVRTATMPSSLSSLLGIAVRIAERMGLDSEADLAKHSVLEAEMRRRLWWSLVIFDHRTREKTQMHSSSLVPTWDCKVPLNVNDCDLRAETKEPPAEEAHGKPTEALFAVVRAEMADFVRNTPSHLDFTMPILKPIARPLPEGGDLAALHRIIEDKHLRRCDEDNPLQLLSKWTVRSYIAKHRLLAHYAKFSNPGPNTDAASSASSSQQPQPPTEAQRATALSYALAMLQCDEKVMGSPLCKGYRWLLEDQFPFPAYVYVVQELRRRPLARHATQAWRVMSDSFMARFRPVEPQFRPMFNIFGNFILRAWDAFEAARKRAVAAARGAKGIEGEAAEPDLTPPPLVPMIRQMLVELDQEAQAAAAAASASASAPASSASAAVTPELTTASGGSSIGSSALVDMDHLDFNNFIMAMPLSGFGQNANLAYSFDRVMQDSTVYEETSPDPLLFSNSGGGLDGSDPNCQVPTLPVDLDFNNQGYWNSLEWGAGAGRGW